METTAERIAYLTARPALSIAEAAELSGLSTTTIRRNIAKGALTHNRVGERILIPTTALLALVGAA